MLVIRFVFALLIFADALLFFSNEELDANLIEKTKFLKQKIQKIQNRQSGAPPFDLLDVTDETFSRLVLYHKKVIQRFQLKFNKIPGWKSLFEQNLAAETIIITKYSFLCGWDAEKLENVINLPRMHEICSLFLKNTCNICCSQPTDANPTMSLNCGHRICVSCVRVRQNFCFKYSFDQVQCVICSNFDTFHSEIYLQFAPFSAYKSIDPFKVPEIPFYYKESEYFFKKCPRLSCDCIFKVKISTGIQYHRYSKACCDNGHVFCLFCSVSFNHSPLRCEELLGNQEGVVLPWPTIFCPANPFLQDENEISCPKCDFSMERVCFTAKTDQSIRYFVDESSTILCRKCKHFLPIAGQSSQHVLNVALLLKQEAIDFKDLELIPFVSLLKEILMTLLLTFYFAKNEVQKLDQEIEVQSIYSFFEFYFFIYNLYFNMFITDILSFKRNRSSETLNSISSLSKKLEGWLAEHRLGFSLHTIFYFIYHPIFSIVIKRRIDIWRVIHLAADEILYLINIFEGNYEAFENSLCFEIASVITDFDPLVQAAENLKFSLMQNQNVIRVLERHLQRKIEDEDIFKMVRVACLTTRNAIILLNNGIPGFLTACKIPFFTLCSAEGCSSIAIEHFYPSCRHNMLCESCFAIKLKEKIDTRQWNEQTGLIKCFSADCSQYFDANLMKLIIEDGSDQFQEYKDFIYSLYLSLALRLKIKIECASCDQFFEYEDFYFYETEITKELCQFRQKHNMFLRLVKCPYCKSKMCANCNQSLIHYSAPCGINIYTESAFRTSMCPVCKKFFICYEKSASSSCPRCASKVCTACGIEEHQDQNCLNSFYSPSYYCGVVDGLMSVFDIIHENRIKLILKNYHEIIATMQQRCNVFILSPIKTVRSLAKIILEGFMFFYWHVLLVNYIQQEFYKKNRKFIARSGIEIEEKLQLSFSLLEANLLNQCADACEDLLRLMEIYNDFLLSAKITNKLIFYAKFLSDKYYIPAAA